LCIDLTRNVASTWPRTYCFAHAGGDARNFVGWQDALLGVTELVAVTPTQRTTIEDLCDRAAAMIATDSEGPFLLFGHSLGALVAFEVARRLGNRPGHLIASGCAAPSRLPTRRMIEMANLEGQRFAEAVKFYGGLNPEILADPDLQEIMLPAVLADFGLVAGYQYRPASPLPFGISLINGTGDPSIRQRDLAEWSRESVTAPHIDWVDGGHFYFEDHPEMATDVIQRAARDLYYELI
jgi:surfactin synthase thioesterase subunit